MPLLSAVNSNAPRRLRLRVLRVRHLSGERLFVLSFASTIVAGALLLSLPFAAAQGSMSWVDALFMSTSAVCVTGLSSIAIHRDLSFGGQIILLLLCQIGGLGILTFSAVFFVLLGRGLGTREWDIMQSAFLYAPRRDISSLLKFIVLSTAVWQGAGALLLWLRFSQDFAWGEALYRALFHAVSAFNNAGFSLFSSSFVAYRGDLIVNLVVMVLIVAGGVGFIVHYELFQRVFGDHRRLSVHSRVALLATAVLIVGGAGLFFFFEAGGVLEGLPWTDRLLASLFQSVTARTAGFNTVDISMLTNQSLVLLMVLMFIGASPGSTGGGVKTTSAAVLFIVAWNRLRGSEEAKIFNRTLPRDILQRSVAITLVSLLSIGAVFLLLLFEADFGGSPAASRHLFAEYLFEAVSAFGTVGLSMNVTPSLSTTQKLSIIAMMFIGRVGPLTLAYSLARLATRKGLVYAEEGVMVG